MWWTVACRLCLRGQTTRIEYIGGEGVPPGDSMRIADGGSEACGAPLPAPASSFERRASASDGRFNLMEDGAMVAVSGANDDAEDLSDLVLVREVRTDGSELADDAAGESCPKPGDDV